MEHASTTYLRELHKAEIDDFNIFFTKPDTERFGDPTPPPRVEYTNAVNTPAYVREKSADYWLKQVPWINGPRQFPYLKDSPTPEEHFAELEIEFTNFGKRLDGPEDPQRLPGLQQPSSPLPSSQTAPILPPPTPERRGPGRPRKDGLPPIKKKTAKTPVAPARSPVAPGSSVKNPVGRPRKDRSGILDSAVAKVVKVKKQYKPRKAKTATNANGTGGGESSKKGGKDVPEQRAQSQAGPSSEMTPEGAAPLSTMAEAGPTIEHSQASSETVLETNAEPKPEVSQASTRPDPSSQPSAMRETPDVPELILPKTTTRPRSSGSSGEYPPNVLQSVGVDAAIDVVMSGFAMPRGAMVSGLATASSQENGDFGTKKTRHGKDYS